MDLSIVVPARDAAGTLPAALDALIPQLHDGVELVVIDDGSRDGTAETVRRAADRGPIRLVDGGGRGPSHARNVGVTVAGADLLAFCDADDVVGEGWVAAIRSSLERHPYVTGPRETERLNPAWLVSILGHGHRQLPCLFGVLPFAPTSNLGVHRGVLAAAGGFDEHLRVGEDLDLALRLWQRGIALHFDDDAVVHYRYRDRPRDLWRQGHGYGRAVVEVARRMRRAGMTGVPRFEDPGKWLWLVYRAGQVVRPRTRARWLWQAGLRAGYVEGSIRSRTLLL